MPRVVPSDVVAAAERMFPDMIAAPNAFPGVAPDQVPRLAALANLADAVAPELVRLGPEAYARLVASLAYARCRMPFEPATA
jgi:hypothetical protein